MSNNTPYTSTSNSKRPLNNKRDAADNTLASNYTKVAITTEDNPYDPFTQFEQWFKFDVQSGYNTCAYLARVSNVSSQLSEKEKSEEIEKAIDEIIRLDFTNLYRKVKKK